MKLITPARLLLVTALVGFLGTAYGHGAFLGVRAADLGVYRPAPPSVGVKVTPSTLNCDSQGNHVQAKITGSFSEEAIRRETVRLGVAGADGSVGVAPGEAGGSSGPLKFVRSDVCALVAGRTGEVTIWVSGSLSGGGGFYGTDTIRAN